MKPGSEAWQSPDVSRKLLKEIHRYRGPDLAIMEVCGTHTVAVARMGLKSLLPHGVRLISGPGCPVCVTPVEVFDEARFLVSSARLTLATYGDALRVPGSEGTLSEARAQGGDVRVVYSALDALELARSHPGREVVFLGLGFETTSPTIAATVKLAREQGIANFSVLSAHKALMPAMEALLVDPDVKIGAFLCPGHATMVLGHGVYEPLTERYRVPCVVAGFEPHDVLLGIVKILRMVEAGQPRVENAYPRAVSREGNVVAVSALEEVFERVDSRWRGLGSIPGSGYDLREAFSPFDARRRFLGGVTFPGIEPAGCLCAQVLRGVAEPSDCPSFASRCTPESPVGACMVSSEGACGAHFRFREI